VEVIGLVSLSSLVDPEVTSVVSASLIEVFLLMLFIEPFVSVNQFGQFGHLDLFVGSLLPYIPARFQATAASEQVDVYPPVWRVNVATASSGTVAA
jgi:hypothetical protein